MNTFLSVYNDSKENLIRNKNTRHAAIDFNRPIVGRFNFNNGLELGQFRTPVFACHRTSTNNRFHM